MKKELRMSPIFRTDPRPLLMAALLAAPLALTSGYAIAAAPALNTGPQTALPAASGAVTAPRIIVIDRTFILQRSSAGRDMVNQVQGLSKQAETQFKTEENQLGVEAQALQQQLAILAPDVREQKEKDFTAKQQSLQQRVQQRQAQITGGFNKAAQQVEAALNPILNAIMRERGANMVLDRTAVLLAAPDVDVTAQAVQQLDKSLPHVKVELASAAEVAAGTAPRPAAAARPAPAKK
jgi:Skp family chaperone for outer membrane proteins